MISIYTPENLIETNALKTMLEAEGITVHVRDEPKARVSIVVPEEQADKAYKLIQEYLSSLPTEIKPENDDSKITKKQLALFQFLLMAIFLILTILFCERPIFPR